MSGSDAAAWVAATPQRRARAAADALGAEELASWCAQVLSGQIELASCADPDPRWLAARAWTSWGDPASWAERDIDYWARVWAGRTLVHVWHPVAEPAVVAALADAHWRVREMSARVTRTHELAAAASACAARILSDSAPRVRIAALQALSATGEHEQAAAVLAACTDPDPRVRDAAERTRIAMERRLDRPLE